MIGYPGQQMPAYSQEDYSANPYGQQDPYYGTTDLGQKLAMSLMYQPKEIPQSASGTGLVGGVLSNLAGRLMNAFMAHKMMKQEDEKYKYLLKQKQQEDLLKDLLTRSMIAKNMAQTQRYGRVGGASGGSGGSSGFGIPPTGTPTF